jgi:hypothetical protein
VKRFLIFLGALLVIGGLISAGREGFETINKQRQEKERIERFYSLPKISPDTSSINTLVTGFKASDLTVVEAVNDSGKNQTKVSTLPSDIKFIAPLRNGRHLLYIGGVGAGDQGLRLDVKEIKPAAGEKDGKITTIYEARDGYKIDRLLISENHEWITWYELKPPEGMPRFTHGLDHYQAFKANISDLINTGRVSPITWVKLTEQKSEPGVVIYLPSIITNEGRVYFDGIVASDYGLFSGFVDENLTNIIPKDQYSGKPFLFNQRYIAYTAFNPDNNPKLPAGSSPAAREAVINANTVRVLDLFNPNAPPVTVGFGNNGEHYKHPVYVKGDISSELVIAVGVYKIAQSGIDKGRLRQSEIQLLKYSKSRGTEIVRITDVPENKVYRILAVGDLPNGEKTLILGSENGTMGNLGTGWHIGISGYLSMLSEIFIYNLDRVERIETIRPETAGHLEFIGLLNKGPQAPLAIDRNEELLSLLPGFGELRGQQLQLETFIPVEPERSVGINPRLDCQSQWEEAGYPSFEACNSCPIYVYSKSVLDVTLRPTTPLIEESASPPLVNGEWSFKADSVGNLILPNMKRFDKIDFLFPRVETVMPEYGQVVRKADFERELRIYSKNLGFVGREIEDIVKKILPELKNTEYIVLSHLDQNQVNRLLNFTANPVPKTKISHIIYVKKYTQKPDIKIAKPLFQAVTRSDYTIVSWGAIVE